MELIGFGFVVGFMAGGAVMIILAACLFGDD